MANLVTPMPMIRTRFFDDNGRPLSGGKVYTYEPNTTTPKTTYKDLAATIPNTNPILLDVAGEADIYFDGQYRVIVKSWRGEQLYDVDNIGALSQIKASYVVDASGKTQQEINNGVESIAELLAIQNPFDRMRVYVKGYYAPTNLALAQPYKGGGVFVFNINKVGVNNGITIFNGWERLSDEIDTYKAGLRGDGVTDDLTAIRNYVMFLAKKGGGTVIFSESDLGYRFSDAIYVVSNVSFEINSQRLIGTSGKSLFKTACVVSGAYVPITTFDPNNVIINSQISNATIDSSSIAFDLRSFTLLCSVKNIQFQNCTQGFVLHDCFYSRWENLQATPTSGSIALPFYHLAAANNAMIFDRVSCTVAWGWLIEGGSTALQFNVCTFEGGSKGYVLKGDVLGCAFNTGYYEAVTGTLFDFSEAGNCVLSFESNYINGVDIVFQDGSTGVLLGNWEASNIIVNIGNDLGTGFTFRGLMNVDSARNRIKFNLTADTGANTATPANWKLSKLTDFNRLIPWNADGVTDIRAAADVHGGVIPVKYSGDFGSPFIDNIHFCTKSSLAIGASVSLNIDTKLTYQPLSLFVKVVLEFRREVGGIYQYYYVYGDIYGSIFELKGGLDVNASKQVTATVVNNSGNLRIILNNIANPNGDLVVTGTVRAVS
ncbi:hypothetical protein [Acinetobacter junii]|uniref:hypothetical protein n=1 Tax=Acinetobacter junii TaxID=40215 RepID=UPI00209153C5|nr:hypothetical protein [Acinetobacter junii]USR72549.1 hypothetical protein NGM19_11060 [Acinetobacter junii]